MTSVIGLDIGQYGSKIGCARNRGIDVLTNEVSNRTTPTLVAFGPRSRMIGESAKTQETSNFKNTVGSLKRLVGRTLDDPDVQIEKNFLNAELVKTGSTVGVQVNYLGEQTTFSATQLYAMFLARLADTASKETKAPVNDVVIAVPVWYTEQQRRAVQDAADIAGLHTLRLINETTATALGYGITKTDLPPQGETPRTVAFVDIGHSSYSVAIASFNKGSLVVKGTAADRHFGGRDLDSALVDHFAEQFKGKYKIDVKSNKKAVFRLTAAVEKLKKILSANPLAPLSVESIMNDIDASSQLKREEFEALIAPLLEKTTKPLEEALAMSGLSKEDIDAVELVGGSTRVPALKTRIQEFFGKPLSTTTNQDEAIARGATLACAQLSPVFRVREFAMLDTQMYPIKLTWEASPDADADEGTELVAFPKGNMIPSNKVLSFSRSQPFEVQAVYAEPTSLPGGINPWIGKYTVKEVSPAGGKSLVKLQVSLNLSGTVEFKGATLVEDGPAEESTDAMDTDSSVPPPAAAAGAEGGADAAPAAEGEAAPAPVAKKPKKIRTPLKTIAGGLGLDESIKNDFREREGQMAASDKLVAETEDRKNALEEYVYDVREKLDGSWKKFASSQEAEQLRAKASESEDWLYSEEGEDATKSAYVQRLDGMKSIGDPILFRVREQDERSKAASVLRETIARYLEPAQSGDEKYAHIPEADLQKVIETCANAEGWLSNKLASQAEKALYEKPVITSVEMRKRADEVMNVCHPIMNRLKPKPKVEATPTPAPDATKQQQQAPAQDGATPEVEMQDDAAANGGDAEPVVEDVEQKMQTDDVD